MKPPEVYLAGGLSITWKIVRKQVFNTHNRPFSRSCQIILETMESSKNVNFQVEQSEW